MDNKTISEQDSPKNKIRILMCSSDRKEKGGINSVIDQLMDHNWDPVFDFSYLATHISGNVVKKTTFFVRSYIKLKKLLAKNTFDIIHIHMSYKGSFYRKYYVTKLCKKYNKKVIIHLHGSEFKDFYNNGDKERKAQIEELFTIADVSIVLGEDWRKFIAKIAPKSNIKVINNAIKLPEPQEKEFKHTRTLLFLGALIKRKGTIDLLQAVKNLSDKGINNYKLLIAGTGKEEETLKKYVLDNSLSNNVEFLGWVTSDQKTDLLKKSDILVLPSYNEGLPIAILESMSYAMPIISTDVGSISEAVTGENGFLFTPGDVDALTKNIQALLCDDDLLKKQSENSRMIAENKFSDEKFFKHIEQVYLSLVSK